MGLHKQSKASVNRSKKKEMHDEAGQQIKWLFCSKDILNHLLYLNVDVRPVSNYTSEGQQTTIKISQTPLRDKIGGLKSLLYYIVKNTSHVIKIEKAENVRSSSKEDRTAPTTYSKGEHNETYPLQGSKPKSLETTLYVFKDSSSKTETLEQTISLFSRSTSGRSSRQTNTIENDTSLSCEDDEDDTRFTEVEISSATGAKVKYQQCLYVDDTIVYNKCDRCIKDTEDPEEEIVITFGLHRRQEHDYSFEITETVSLKSYQELDSEPCSSGDELYEVSLSNSSTVHSETRTFSPYSETEEKCLSNSGKTEETLNETVSVEQGVNYVDYIEEPVKVFQQRLESPIYEQQQFTPLAFVTLYTSAEESRHSEYWRFLTFTNWPYTCPYSASVMAHLGFFVPDSTVTLEAEKVSDRARCFACNWEASNWSVKKNPLQRHEELSPQCPLFDVQQRGNVRNEYLDEPLNVAAVLKGTLVFCKTVVDDMRFTKITASPLKEVLLRIRTGSPQYKLELHRVSSYLCPAWQRSGAAVSPFLLAKNGFYYLGDNDRVKCFFCCNVLKQWEDGDDPAAEHQRHFPDCDFVMGYNTGNVPWDGKSLETSVFADTTILNSEERVSNNESSEVLTDNQQRSNIADNGRSRNLTVSDSDISRRINSPLCRRLIHNGFQKQLLQEVIKEELLRNRDFKTSDALIRAYHRKEREIRE